MKCLGVEPYPEPIEGYESAVIVTRRRCNVSQQCLTQRRQLAPDCSGRMFVAEGGRAKDRMGAKDVSVKAVTERGREVVGHPKPIETEPRVANDVLAHQGDGEIAIGHKQAALGSALRCDTCEALA